MKSTDAQELGEKGCLYSISPMASKDYAASAAIARGRFTQAGLRPGHPRLSCLDSARTWMPGTRPGKTI
jgi:hypothetical protein